MNFSLRSFTIKTIFLLFVSFILFSWFSFIYILFVGTLYITIGYSYVYYKSKRDHIELISFKDYAKNKANSFINSIIVFLAIVPIIVYTVTYAFPLKLSSTELVSVDGKRIILQGMMHMAEPSFYNGISNKIDNLKSQGYVYYFEGVRPGTDENNEKFSNLIGLKISPEMYSQFQKLYGLADQGEYQSTFIGTGILAEQSKNVDMDIDQIVKELEDRGVLTNNSNILNPNDVNKALGLIDEMGPVQLYMVQELNKFTMSMVLRSTVIVDQLWKVMFPDQFHDVLLSLRNEHIANEIINSKDKKIILTYGELHSDGITKILLKNGYGIVKTTYLEPLVKNSFFINN